MILLLGGTSDSLAIAQELTAKNISFVFSVATDYGEQVAKGSLSNVKKGRMDEEAMTDFIQKENISLILDGTHPFATLVSQTAISVAEKSGISYVRYERPGLDLGKGLPVQSIEKACELALTYKGSIYLTTGSKTLKDYLKYLPAERIVARILPTAEVLTMTEQLGLQAHQIEALKGPFSRDMNIALIKHNQAGVLITKESGTNGGLSEKLEACERLDIPCIVILKEKLNYPECFNSLTEIVLRCEEENV